MRTSSLRRRVAALASVAVLGLAGAACDPDSRATPGPTAVQAEVDTFSVSNHPTARRSTDVVMRVMDSQGKEKVGYTSFPVASPDTHDLDATLVVTPRQTGFALEVHNSGAFDATTTHVTRPALGTGVGTLARTTAGSPQAIPLHGVTVTGGQALLAVTTTSPYELEVVSTEGAARSGHPEQAPILVTAAKTAAPPAAPEPTTTPVPTAKPVPSGGKTAPIDAPDPRPGPTPPSPDWKLTFDDEFDGTSVDPAKWNVYDESRGQSVESPKDSTCPKASNVTVGGGTLVMRTQKADGTCAGGQAQSGAGMNTFNKFAQAGGRFEARVRWTERGNYLWGGFWTSDRARNDGTWTKDNPSEIDTFEYIGKVGEPNINRFKPAIHYNYTCNGHCGGQSYPYMDHDVTQWHTYAVEWEPTDPADPTTMQIRFYVDDVLITVFDKDGTWQVSPSGTRILTTPGGWNNPKGPFPNPFNEDHPHELTLSAWVGAPGVDAATVARGYDPAGGHADLEVDYVRVYER